MGEATKNSLDEKNIYWNLPRIINGSLHGGLSVKSHDFTKFPET